MSTKAKRHVHKYHRVSVWSSKVWACALPDCSHYMPTHLSDMVVGKYSVCWKCEETFILDTENMKNDKPICSDCNESLSKLNDLLANVGN